jgi:thioredoxin 1
MTEAYMPWLQEYLKDMGIDEIVVKTAENEEELDKAVCRHSTTIVLFSSPTCPACAAYRPIFYTYAYKALKKYGEKKVGFYEADVYNMLEKAWELGISATPTTIIFKKCKPVDGIIGLVDEEYLAELVENI